MPLEDWFDRMGGVTPIHANLYRSPLPYTRPHFEQLRKAGIQVIFSHEHAVPGQLARDMGFDWRPHFWTDDMPPSPGEMRAFLDDYATVPKDTPALVHCKAGWGRTGSAITCALVEHHDMTIESALKHYWARVPAAKPVMMGNGQADFVRGWAAARAGRGLY